MERTRRLGYGKIFLFWFPLALTWLMMAVEGPFLAAVVARLAEPKANLAAHGVAFAVAIMIEAPIIMIMSASTALARDREAFLKLRIFTYVLNFIITATQALLLVTPGMAFITLDLMSLPPEVSRLVINSLWILLPWPGAIGYRRFYQGLLIRGGQTRRVAYGTVVRVTSMAATGTVLYLMHDIPGAYVGAAALSAGVTLEAIAVRFMVIGVRKEVLTRLGDVAGGSNALSYRAIGRFYFPLAMTSTIALAIHPMVTFFVGQSRFALESLAVIPVINGLVFFFRAPGISYLEAAIALMGDEMEHYQPLRNFAAGLGSVLTLGLGLIALTPLSTFYFEEVSGLTPALAEFALVPIMILAIFPVFSVLLSLQRAVLIKAHITRPVNWATCIEVGGTVGLLILTIHLLGMVGAVAAALALLVGRVAGVLFLVKPVMISRRRVSGEGTPVRSPPDDEG